MFSKVFGGCILLFLSISFVHCLIWEPHNTVKETVCRSNTCIKRGNEYFDNLHPVVNPCDDFYSFVCGVWHVKNKPPRFAAEWSTQDLMEKRVIKDLKDILSKPAISTDRELLQVQHFYEICMKRPFLDRLDPNEVGKRITTVGRYKKKKLWDIHQQYLELTSESAFFSYFIYGYPNRDFMPLLILRDVDSAYGLINHGDWKPQEEKNYSQFLFLLMKSLNLKHSPTDAVIKDKIKAVLAFRNNLNNISNLSKKQKMMQLNPKTARDYQKWFKHDYPRGSKPKNPEMPWEKIIKAILSSAPKQFHDMAITTMRDDEYFKDLESLVSSASEEVLVDHMEIYFAERHTKLTTAWEDLLEKTSIEPSNVLQPVRQDVPRYVSCIKDNNLWPLISKILQRKWFRKDILPPMEELISGLKMAMTAAVKESTWLNAQTKEETAKKILSIKSWIGYPPWYTDPTTSEKLTSPENDPLHANAYLDLDKFVMYIKSPLLSPPVYDPDLPNVYNLGGIGYLVGHELYHTVEDCGLYYDDSGKAVRWWPTEMRDRCKKQLKCFVDAYDKETQRVFELTYHEKIKGGNYDSYHEDIPDVMGLSTAFRLYQVLKKRDKNICQTLPRFEKYTCEQMFFIAYANTMCGRMTAKAAKNQIETEVYSLDSIRVNGAVMHNKEFAKAFQCPKGKPMNPDIKCNLWT